MTTGFSELRSTLSPQAQARVTARTERLLRRMRDAAWSSLTLAELQILQQGLWVLGEQDRVDVAVLPVYQQLRGEVKAACARALLALVPEEGA